MKAALRGLSCALALLAAAAARGEVQVTDLRIWDAPDSTRVVLELSGPAPYNVFALDGPPRVVLDLGGVGVPAGITSNTAPNSSVAGVRYGARGGGTTRVVLDLARAQRYEGFLLEPNEHYGHRLVLDLYPLTGPAVPRLPAPPVLARTAPDSRPGAAATAPVQAQPPQALQVSLPPAAPAAVERPQPPPPEAPALALRPVTIVVDAGHGGEDPGATGRGGTREKTVVLAIARKLAARIDAEPGMRAVLTRKGDYFLPLRERVAVAHRVNADLFVSIHADAAVRRSARGSGVYALSESGASNEAARLLAAKENAADRIGGVPVPRTQDPMLRSVLLDLSQNATIENGLRLAQHLLGNIRDVNKVHQHSVQQAGFVVLKSPHVPSVLVETAFISNPEEERRLRDPAFHARLADALLAGIRSYLAADPRLRQAVAHVPVTHVVQRGETLSGLAVRYGVDTSTLQEANPELPARVRIGDRVVIPAATGG